MNFSQFRVSDQTKGFAAIISVVLIWSSLNVISRAGSLHHLTPYDLAALRFGISGVIAFPFFLYRVPFQKWPQYGVMAIFGGLGYCLFFYSGFAFAPTAHASIFVSGGIPFWTVLLGILFFKRSFPRLTLIALLISVAGLLLISGESLFADKTHLQWIGDLLFFAGAACYAIFGLLIQRWKPDPINTVLGVATISCLIYFPFYLLWLPDNLHNIVLHEIEFQSFSHGIMAGLIAGALFAYAVIKIGPCEAGMVLALVPGLTTLGAAWVLGESIHPDILTGVCLVSLGALLGARANKPQES